MSDDQAIGIMAAIIYAGEHAESNGVGYPLIVEKAVARARKLLDEAANQAARRTRAEREKSF